MKKILNVLLVIIIQISAAYAVDFKLDKEVVTFLPGNRPAKGVAVNDPVFHTSLVRVSDVSDDGIDDNMASIVYSRWTPLNSNAKYLYLQRTVGWNDALLYDAFSHSVIKALPRTTTVDGVVGKNFVTLESAEIRWDYSGDHPNRFYYISDTRLLRYEVDKDRAYLIHDFAKEYPGASRILNNVEGDSSSDSRYWAFMVQDAYDGNRYPMIAVITYDKQADKILGTMDVTKYQSLGGRYGVLPTPNMVEISPSGTKVIFHTGRCYEPDVRPLDIGTFFDGPHAWDLDFTNPVKVSIDETHSGWAWGYDGSELFVSQNNRTDWIEARNIHTGETTKILAHGDLGWNNGMHFARMPKKVKGWVLMSTYAPLPNKDWGDNQLIMIEVKDSSQNPRVWRLGHTCNNYDEYYSEGFAAMSQFGDKLWWNAKWPGTSDIETYEMELPYKWWEAMNGFYTDSHNPKPGAVNVSCYKTITVHIKNTGGNTNSESIAMTVNGKTVFDGSDAASYPQTILSGTPRDYALVYTPLQQFNFGEVVDVTVDAQASDSPVVAMPHDSYSFTVSAGDANLLDLGITKQLVVVGSSDGKGTINPSKGEKAKIFFQGASIGTYECRIFTLNGEQLWSASYDNVRDGMFEWDARNMATGTYVVMVKGPGYHKTAKIIVLK